MVQTILSGASARHPLRLVSRVRPYRTAPPHRFGWIKRRARSLQSAYVLSRREAVANAALDWSHFNPRTVH